MSRPGQSVESCRVRALEFGACGAETQPVRLPGVNPVMNPSTEAELIARCRRGEAEAWDQLFDRFYAATGRFIFQLSPDFSHEDVEEICQEVFLAVVQKLGAFQGSSQLQTWIFRIALNKARDFRERQHARKRGGGVLSISLQATDPEHGLALDPPSANPGPDVQLLQAEQLAM